jgi:hypothetical protein
MTGYVEPTTANNEGPTTTGYVGPTTAAHAGPTEKGNVGPTTTGNVGPTTTSVVLPTITLTPQVKIMETQVFLDSGCLGSSYIREDVAHAILNTNLTCSYHVLQTYAGPLANVN